MARDFDVVICARNNRDVIAGTLSAVGSLTRKPQRCIVVDGQSTDGTVDLIRKEFPWAEVVVKTANDGPGASRNIGWARSTAPWVLFLDSDVSLAPDWAEQQIRFLEGNSARVAVAGKLVYASEPETLNAAYGAMNRYGVAWGVGDREKAGTYLQARRCLWNLTAALMVRRSALEEIGGFDELMFAYHEDTDFGWRANLFGYEVNWNPEAVAYHRAHSTMNKSSMGDHRAFLAYRNRFRSALINYEPFHLIRYMGVHLALFLMQTCVKSQRSARLRALMWNLSVLRDTLQRRHFVQTHRRVRDRDLWPLFESGFRGPGYE